MTERLPCGNPRCAGTILPSTADRTGGLCMPCFQVVSEPRPAPLVEDPRLDMAFITMMTAELLASGSGERQVHKLVVRPGWETEIVLPVDLTVAEAKRLAAIIRRLPHARASQRGDDAAQLAIAADGSQLNGLYVSPAETRMPPSQVDELKPSTRQRVMDLVRMAGHDVSAWGNFKGGVRKAATNPAYCYDWVFAQSGRAPVVNVWHDEMRESGGVVCVSMTLRERDDFVGPQRTRARKLLEALVAAGHQNTPLRVIVNDGTRASAKGEAGHVTTRLLDATPWHVQAVDPVTGACTLARGPGLGGVADQFDDAEDPSAPIRRATTTETFVRDPNLRRSALARARGVCEYCGTTGFTMLDGRVFLETHHVRPLGEGGLDRADNIVAICANDHREAHHGVRAPEIRNFLTARIAQFAPNAG